MKTCRSDAIAAFLGREHHGQPVELAGVTPLAAPESGHLVFAKAFTQENAENLNRVPGVFVIACEPFGDALRVAHVLSPRPRLDFARAVARFFVERRPAGVAATAVVAPDAVIAPDASIGEACVIGARAFIGEGTVLGHHVVVGDDCRLGRFCRVKSQSVIGEKGFGFERDEEGRPVALPHLGRVLIGDRVEIGALNTIARGTVGDTVIEDDVKTDDHVHIAHNCRIGAGTLITACAELSGSVRVGPACWIGPQAAINNGLEIGAGAFIGIGAVVTKTVAAGQAVAGNPARALPGRSPANQ